MTNQTQAVATMGPRLMAGAMDKISASGNRTGRVLSFLSEYPAGDISAALKAKGLKGKALKRKVREVITGNCDMAWALYEAEMSVCRSLGYVPVRMESNKNSDVIKPRLELGNKGVAMRSVDALSDEEILGILEQRKQARKEAPAIDTTATVEKPTETQPTA